MSSFELLNVGEFGKARVGSLETRRGEVKTPAFFPVVNLIGGTTVRSGGIWSRLRNRLFNNKHFQGAMFQAMSFLDFNVTPEHLKEWRKKPMHEWYQNRKPRDNAIEPPADFTRPLFVDSGGFKLMNSQTFANGPNEGNEWGIYTNPESILKLQLDYGADIIATLDYPLPPNLNEEEKEERMKESIKSAKKCLSLVREKKLPRLENRDEPPNVFVAVHGHDYEWINWYVSRVVDEINDASLVDGIAVGSLVPLRSNIETLIEIVQGAKRAIPKQRSNNLALHVFGISGDLFALLSLLGVDSFDSSSFVQSAMYQKFIIHDSWTRKPIEKIDDWDCNCEACNQIDFSSMKASLETAGRSSPDQHGFLKSDYYALIAMHNFLVYQKEINRIREIIQSEDQTIIEYVLEQAKSNKKIQKGLIYAQRNNRNLRQLIKRLDRSEEGEILLGQPQQQSSSSTEREESLISLKHTPSDFNVLARDHSPLQRPVLLILPCSRTKPYSQSRTHQVVSQVLDDLRQSYYKVSISGLFGPVPEDLEKTHPINNYDYVLSDVDESQRKLVVNRTVDYLDAFGDQHETIIGYASSKTYREVLSESFSQVTFDTRLLPTNPKNRQLIEHFRNENLAELRAEIQNVVQESNSSVGQSAID